MSNGGGGISASEAHRIAQQVVAPVQQRVSELHREVSQVSSQVSAVDRRVQELEAEMGRVANAIGSLNSDLNRGLNSLQSASHNLLESQQSAAARTDQQLTGITEVNRSGFGTLSSDMHVVDGSVKQMAQAMVQMEVVRQLHEVKGPAKKAEKFQEEIDQRFVKAVESVHSVRGQYDAMQFRVAEDLDKKLRHIGSHIYRVLEEDFEVFGEGPLSEPFDSAIALGLEVDLDAISRREAALEATLEAFGEARLEPLLTAQADLEHALASRYTLQEALPETTYVPISLLEAHDAQGRVLGVFADARFSRNEDGPGLAMSRDGQAVAERASPLVDGAFEQLPKRPIQPNERREIAAAVQRMASAGAIPADLVSSYISILERAELLVIDQGEVTGR